MGIKISGSIDKSFWIDTTIHIAGQDIQIKWNPKDSDGKKDDKKKVEGGDSK